MKAIDEIERSRREELERLRFEDFVKRWGPEDGDPRFIYELQYLIANAVEIRTNALGRMMATSLSCSLTIANLGPVLTPPEKR